MGAGREEFGRLRRPARPLTGPTDAQGQGAVASESRLVSRPEMVNVVRARLRWGEAVEEWRMAGG